MYRVCVRPSGWRAAGRIRKFSLSKLSSTVYQQPSLTKSHSHNGATSTVREFARRHVGPNDVQTTAMLEYLQLEVISLLFTRFRVGHRSD